MDEKEFSYDEELKELIDSFKDELADIIEFTKKYLESEPTEELAYSCIVSEVGTDAG